MDDLEDTFEKTKTKIMDEARRVFKPEFLNRINSLIVFHQLARKHLRKIVDIEIRGITGRLAERGMPLEISNSAKDFLIEQGFDEKFGARPLRRAVEQFLEDPLAESLLRGDLKEGEVVHVDVADDGKSLRFTQKSPAAEV
jgi:ATP-dependent Clp protease ATP-binding subunit ClpC